MNNIRKNIYSIVKTTNRSILNKIYLGIMALTIGISVVPLCTKQTFTIFDHFDRIAFLIFLLDYILHWITADFKYAYKKITKKRAFITYPFHFHAIVDLIAILSTLPALFPGSLFFQSIGMIKLLRLLKCIRIFKLFKYSTSFNIIYVILVKQKKVLLTVGFIALAYIFISAILIFQIEPETFPNFFYAIYWAVISLTTVGYGDIFPVSTIGRLFSMVSAFFGIALVTLPAGIISAGYLEIIMEKKGEGDKNQP